MTEITRCQAAILQGDRVLLILHREHGSGRSYWLLPGGRWEDGETAEECVRREMWEETGLTVRVERLLYEEPSKVIRPGGYTRYWTYLCTPLSGEAKPGYEPEPEPSTLYAIAEVGWFDLRDASTWGEQVLSDPLTAYVMKKLQHTLGYA